MDRLAQESWTRRRVLAGGATAAIGAAALAITGCGDDDDAKSAPTSLGAGPTPTPSAEKPVKGGTLRVGHVGTDSVFNTGFPFVALPQNRYFHDAMIEGLARYRDSLTPELVLAEKIEPNADRSKWTITVKQGVTFHNGAPVTIDDWLFGVDVILEPKKYGVTGNFQLINFAQMIKERKKVDDRTVELTLDKPRYNYMDFLAQLKVTHAASYPKMLTAQEVQGTGPYLFKSWTPNQSFKFAPNPNYHLQSKLGGPHLDGIESQFFSDADAAALSFESGSIDLITQLAINGTIAKRFRDKGLTRMATKTGLFYAGANVTNPLLKDARVRQAMFHAIDRKRFQEEIGEKFSSITVQPWPKTSPAFDPAYEAPYYDPAKAKDLMKQAGWVQDKPLKMEYAGATYQTQAAVLKENWEAIGVKVDLLPQEGNAFNANFQARKLTDLWISGHSFSELAPLTNFQQTFPYRIPNIGYYGEPGGNSGQEYVKMIAELELLDPVSEAAKAVYKRFNELFVTEAWLLPFAGYDRIDLVSDKVRGFEYLITSAGSPDYGKIWKKA